MFFFNSMQLIIVYKALQVYTRLSYLHIGLQLPNDRLQPTLAREGLQNAENTLHIIKTKCRSAPASRRPCSGSATWTSSISTLTSSSTDSGQSGPRCLQTVKVRKTGSCGTMLQVDRKKGWEDVKVGGIEGKCRL